MRYLFGDSVPFQLQYNFLTTLEAFVTSAAQAVRLAFEIQSLLVSTADAAAARAKAEEVLDTYHRAVMGSLLEHGMGTNHAIASDYTRKLREYASAHVEGVKRNHVQATDREQAGIRGEIERRRTEIRTVLEAFLVAAQLPTLDTKVSMTLEGGHNQFSAVFTNSHKIVTSFKLSTAATPAWAGPRRVSEFAQGISLQVGTKKSWITRKVQPEVVQLDDFFVGSFEMNADAARIRLRKKPDLKDSLVFKLLRTETAVLAEVQRPEEDTHGEGPHPVIDAQDRAQLEKLWQLIRSASTDMLSQKERLLSAELDGADIFEGELAVGFVQRIIRMFSPIVAELSRRSPSPMELSLKRETDDGRREELYLRKQDLAAKLEPLTPTARALFAPLALTREESEAEITLVPDED